MIDPATWRGPVMEVDIRATDVAEQAAAEKAAKALKRATVRVIQSQHAAKEFRKKKAAEAAGGE